MVAKEGVNTPKALVEGVTDHVPPAGSADKVNEEALLHIGLTAVIVGVVGMMTVRVVVPTLEQVTAAVGVTTTVYICEELILAIGLLMVVLLKPVDGDHK